MVLYLTSVPYIMLQVKKKKNPEKKKEKKNSKNKGYARK